jgi:hypothetical protein
MTMSSLHGPEFRYRPHLLAFILVCALLFAVFDPISRQGDRASDVLTICLGSVLAYATMRLFVWICVRPIAAHWPRLLRKWGLAWFYGAIPLSVLGLYVGSSLLHAPTPSMSTIAFVFAAAASMAAGAFPTVDASRSRPTNAWSDP